MRALVDIRQFTDTTDAPAQPCFTLYSTSAVLQYTGNRLRTFEESKIQLPPG